MSAVGNPNAALSFKWASALASALACSRKWFIGINTVDCCEQAQSHPATFAHSAISILQHTGTSSTKLMVATNGPDDAVYHTVRTPDASADIENAHAVKSHPGWVHSVCVGLALLHALQNGWSTGQVNLKTFNNTHQCNAHPIVEGTCLMFPGHTKTQWTFLTNAWILGGMIGTLIVAKPNDKFGRRRTLWFNAIIMIVGAVVELTAQGVWQFTIGRLIAGIASGFGTGVVGGYIAEITPPHLRSSFGTMFHGFLTLGILLVTFTFFFWNTSHGWRYSAGFPIVFGGAFLILAPIYMVESPAWLIAKGRQAEAEKEIARLYGEDQVANVLTWLQPARENLSSAYFSKDIEQAKQDSEKENKSWVTIFKPEYRRQLLIAAVIAASHQLSGINSVIFYSSSIFSQAGISDPRIGTVIVDTVNCLPTLIFGVLGRYFKSRSMLLGGCFMMFVSAVGMTFTLVYGQNALSIVFTALYVGAFGVSFGPLIWSVTAELFPVEVRAPAVSFCISMMWICKLIVGVGYPYVIDDIGNYSFVPFLFTLAGSFTFMYFMVPETTNKTIDEIQQEFKALRERKK